MKKAIKKSRVLVSALVLTMVVAMLAACGSSSDSNALVGTWTIDYVDVEGVTVSSDALEEQSVTMSFEFKDDGTITGTVSGESVEGTYTQDGTTVSITFEGETEDLKFEDNVLSWEYEGMGTIYFKN